MGLEMSKRYFSYTFHPISAKLYESIGYHGGIQASTFPGNWPSFKNLKWPFKWHFEILTWSQWETPNLCQILKATVHRAKGMKIWDSQSYELHM